MDEIARRIGALAPAHLEHLDRKLRARGLPLPCTSAAPRPPLSFAQERLWFLDQFHPGMPIYNLPAALRLPGPLDVPALERAVTEIVRRHEDLRTTFPAEHGKPVQRIAPALPVPLPLADLRSLPPEARDAELQRLIAQEARHVFDLARGPLLRALLVRVDDLDHVLVLVTHHIVSDRWSTAVLRHELAALHAAFAAGRPSPLPDLPLQYADHAQQQRDQLQGDRLAALLGYWKQALDGAPAMLELPADRRRPAVPSFRGASQPLVLDPEVSARLARLAWRENVTLFMVLLAAFDALLFRYTGQHDIVVGTPIANRDRPDLEPLIGLFANTLVIRTRLHGTLSFRDLVAQVREVTLGAYAHQELPFEKLVEELHPDRSLSHNPLFQVMFALDARPQIALGLSRFDLTLSVVEHADGLRGTIEYSTDLFDHTTITRMIGHLQTLLAHVAASPDQPLQHLPLLTDAERHELLVTWNATGADDPAEACVHELVEAQVDRTPDAPAVVFQDRSVTYRQLDERANRLAHRLRSLGVGPEVRVGLCVERSLDMVVGALAILKAGGAYLPLDPTYPPQRLATILEEARVPVLVTTSHSEHVLPRYAARVIRIDHVLHGESHRPERTASADSLAYVIYSSGSTGTPKGIEVVHRGVCNIATYQARRFGVYRGDRVLQFFSLGFDAWLWDVLLALTAGATLYVAPEEVRSSGPALAGFLARHRIHVATLLPSVLAVMPQIPLPDLHTILSGGEACSADVVAAWAPGRRFFNVYGPTEASIAATVSRCVVDGRRPAIGRPIDNTTAYILDASLAPVPIGVTGELYLGGIGVARGYFERPALTAARFLADPFSDAPGARLCRTGDLARYTPAGEIELLGRIDDQVKVRGMRIEPSEIEAVLRRHPAIHEATVVLRDGAPGLQLAAYLVLASGHLASPRELRELLRQTLPAYMVPVTFTFLDRLPRGDTGKIDVRGLPEPALLDRTRDPGLVAPRNATERVVAEIWQDILGVERVGVHDNFFDLGGHSLAATRVLSRIHERWKLDIAVCRFFDAPTVAALAELVAGPFVADPGPSALDDGPAALLARVGELSAAEVDALLETLSGSRLSNLSAAEKRALLARLLQDKARLAKSYPLSFAQERLWFLEQRHPGLPIDHLSATLRLPGPLNVPALERAVTEIVRRHEVLRTTFPAEHGKPVQRIAPALPVPLPLADLRSLPPEARDPELQHLVAQESRHGFELARGPLLRALLVRVDDLDHVLVLVTHHIVSDRWSTAVLRHELSTLHAAFAAGRPSPLPELPLQYADHAQQQRDQLQGDRLAALLGYWKQALDGAPALLDRPAVPSSRRGRQAFVLGRELGDQLAALAQREGATLFMVLLAAFDALLFRATGQHDIVVGTPIANRNRPDLEPLIGLFANTLVIRARLHGSLGFRDLVAQIREVTLGAYAHQELPFEKLVEELHPDDALPQVMFALHGAPTLAVHAPETAALALSLVEHADGLRGTIEYSTDLFDPTTITRMIGHLQTLLAHVAASPRQPLHQLMPTDE